MSMYYVYILANKTKSVLYIDSTEDLEYKLKNTVNDTFSIKFKTNYLLYYKCYESYKEASDAKFYLRRISRLKQDAEIKTVNPAFSFLSFREELMVR